MTREQIVDGLSLLVLQLANGQHELPPGWLPHEWAYVKGIASHAILQVRKGLDVGGRFEGPASHESIGLGSNAAIQKPGNASKP